MKLTKLALVIFLYFLVSLIVTYPLINNLGQRIVGGEDANSHLWIGWWFKQAILVEHQNPLAWSNYLFYPDGYSLGTSYDGVIFYFLLGLGQVLIPNQLLVYNLLCLLILTLSAGSVFLLLNYLTKHVALSFLGGLAVGFAPYQIAHLGSGHSNLFNFVFVPLLILRLLKLRQTPSNCNLLAAAVTLFLVGLGSWNYLYFVFLCFGFYVLVRFFTTFRHQPKPFFSWLWRLKVGPLLFITGVLLTPFIWPMISGAFRQETLAVGGSLGAFGSADLTGFFVPPPRSNLGQLLKTGGIYQGYLTYNETEATVFCGWLELTCLLLIFFVTCSFFRARGRVWLLLAGVSTLLSLGPHLRILGEVVFPLPYLLVAILPFASMSRVPARLSIFSMLFLIIFLALNIKELSPKFSLFRKRLLFVGVFVALIVERLFLPMTIFDEPESSFFTKMAQEKEDYAVAYLPRFDVNQDAVANYLQTVHGKKTVGGYISVYSLTPRVLKFLKSNPALYLSYCAGFESGVAENIRQSQKVEALLTALWEQRVRYLIVYKRVLDNKECSAYKGFIESYLEQVPISFEDNLIRVYSTAPQPLAN